MVRADVLGSVVVLPDEAPEIANRPGEKPVARRLIRQDPTERGSLRISDVSSSAEWLRASVRRLEELRPRGKGLPQGHPGDWLLEISVEGDPLFGERLESVWMSTGLERQPVLTLPVKTLLRPPVNLSTTKLLLTDQAVGAVVLLSVREGLDPNALRATAEPEELEIELLQAGGRMYRVHVHWSGTTRGDGSILFTVGDEQLRLPVQRTD